jgi:hypothetical protein
MLIYFRKNWPNLKYFNLGQTKDIDYLEMGSSRYAKVPHMHSPGFDAMDMQAVALIRHAYAWLSLVHGVV